MSEETMNKESATDLNEYDVTPDGFVTEKEMQEGGYTKAEIYPLRYFRAKILYDLGLPVYMLYRDNTERRIKKRQELNSHDWLYGIPKLAWQEFLNTEEALGFIRAVTMLRMQRTMWTVCIKALREWLSGISSTTSVSGSV